MKNAESGNDSDGFRLDHSTLIGVIADPSQHDVVREFFELFKIPWEFYKSGRSYDVVICAGDRQIDEEAGVVLLYAGITTQFDGQQNCLNETKQCQPRLHLPIGNIESRSTATVSRFRQPRIRC